MDLKHFEIIRGPVVSSKSKKVFDDQGIVTFKVKKGSNKSEIKRAVEALWDVKVEKVRTMNVKGKMKRVSGRFFKTGGFKKAIVQMKKGYEIAMPWQQYKTKSSGEVPAFEGGKEGGE